MRPDKLLYKWEKEAVQLRYHEGLCRNEMAEKLKLTPGQVKYIFSKPNVKRYVQEQVLPPLWRKEIAEIEAKLQNRKTLVEAYVKQLIADKKAQTYEWMGPGKKVYKPDQHKRFRAISKAFYAFGVTDPTHHERNVRRDVFKHKAKLQRRLDMLKEKLRQVERPCEVSS